METQKYIIKGAQVVNEGTIQCLDILIDKGIISRIDANISLAQNQNYTEVVADGKYLIPGIIDDQVHFREPGFTHKADIYHEAKAAVAGGVTTFMEMPNTKPAALTQDLLEDKYQIAAANSLANYSFYMGVSNDNIEEVLKTDPKTVCGIKIFMGSSTGNMLVDDQKTLEKIFGETSMLIATHCEDEATVRQNLEIYKAQYGEDIPIQFHPKIRNEAACLKSSSFAVELAKKHNTRLHILHISTADELKLFNNKPLKEKRITSEVCVHHLWFDASDYDKYGMHIKCNPAIKHSDHKNALFEALLDDKLDVIATDHAPHTLQEKKNAYTTAPSGIPLIQHTLNIMLTFHHQNKISLEKIVQKMCHAPADCFKIAKRGYIKEGYYADLAIVDINKKWTVNESNIYYKCKWSPFENNIFKGIVTHTFVNGNMVYKNGQFNESNKGMRLSFKH